MKHNHPFAFYCNSSIVGAQTVMSESSIYPYSGKKRYFSCSSLSITLCNGVSIHEYKAYWYMNFSLIYGCGTSEYNISSHSFFWSGACEFTSIITVTKTVNIQVLGKICNFTIKGTIAKKSQGQSSTLADILVYILINPSNGLNLGIKLSATISASVDDYPCFSTFYYYDPYWLFITNFSLFLSI